MRYLDHNSDGAEKRSLGQKVGAGQHFYNARTEALESGRVGILHTFDDARQGERSAGLQGLVLLGECLQERLEEDGDGRTGIGCADLRCEDAQGFDAGVADVGVGVFEAFDDVGHHLGQVGGEGIAVQSGQGAHQADALTAHYGFLLGVCVVEAGEEKSDALGGKVLGDALEFFYCELLGVAV